MSGGDVGQSTAPADLPSRNIPSAAVLAIPVFVINMARDTERRRHMTERLGELGLPAEFILAVDGREMTFQDRAAYDRAKALRIYGVEMMDSEIGCYLSHHRLYERMVRDGIDLALIVEDDVFIEPTLPTVLDDLLHCAFRDWLVVRLDSKRSQVVKPLTAKHRGTRVATLPSGGELFRLRTQVLGVGAYLIRREGAARMIAYGARMFMPIDQTMDRYWENGILPYVVRPFSVDQGDTFGTHSPNRTAERRRALPWPIVLRRRAQRLEDSLRKRIFNLLHQ